jgi:1-acyl-sn-glycerol-3-phosphate acyltransferase
VIESRSYRSVVVISQHISWFLSQLLRVRYSIRVHRPAGLFERRSECCLILAPNHRTILDPWLLMSALPYRSVRALIPVRPLATQTFTGQLGFLKPIKPIIKVVYWLSGVIQLPPMETDDETLPEKLEDLLKVLKQEGDVVMIFPEGERWMKREPPLGDFAPGVIYLQRMASAPIVPIAMWMSEKGFPRRRCVIHIGQPVLIPEHLNLEAGAGWLREQTLKLYEQAKER